MIKDDNGERAQLEQSMKSGANWFYWIAGLSLITSILSLSGAGWRFFLSLGITQVVDGISLALRDQLGSAGLIIGLVLDIFIIAVFAVLGYLAGRKQTWAFIVGMVLFFIDALLLLIGMDIFAILFHGLALFYIFRGYQAARDLVLREQLDKMQPPPPPQPAEAPSASV
jgi:hypothetical protein